jgi:hypothetical protein
MKARRPDPLLVVLVVVVALARVPAFFWGLPNVDGWDDDGVAPRDVLSGVVETYSPGSFYIYPPLELLLVALLTLPFTLWRLAHAPALTPESLVRAFVEPGAMTVYAIAARLLSVVFGCLTIALVFDGTERLAGRFAGRAAALLAACHTAFAYYMHTTNLDGPLLFWCVLAWRELVRVTQGDPSRWRAATLATAAALATKDQGYATLALPIVLAAGHAIVAAPSGARGEIFARIAKHGLVALALLLFVDGAFVNPSGFTARIAKLRGSASQDYRDYVPGLAGSWAILRDAVVAFPRFLPPEVGALGLLGASTAIRRSRREGKPSVPSLLAPLAALSFFLLFNLVARRTQERFLMPSSFFLVVPAAEVLAALTARRATLRPLGWAALAAIGLRGAREIAAVEFAFLHDPRAAVEDFLAAYASPGERVEVYGNNVYLPRIPAHLVAERVGPSPVNARPLVPGFREVEDAYENLAARSPEWIVIPEAWGWQWLHDPQDERTGRMSAPIHWQSFAHRETQAFFRALVRGERGYELVQVGVPRGFWAHVDMHNTLNKRVFVLRRR